MNQSNTIKSSEESSISQVELQKSGPPEQYSFKQLGQDLSGSVTYIHLSAEESKNDLHQKYNSIYQQLKDIESSQITELFLEELEEHQHTRSKLLTLERHLKKMEDENNEVKSQLSKKRQSIAQLCLTESDHLNLIEHLEGQLTSKYFSSEGHFQKKYRQLEVYMNEYMTSTQEVQEELQQYIKTIQNQNNRLASSHQELQQLVFSQGKQIEVLTARSQRLKKICGRGKEKQNNLCLTISNLQQLCTALKKENESLKLESRTCEQFKMTLEEENKELSSQLDFIRDKINENHTIQKDIFQKIEEHQENSLRLATEVQCLRQDKQRLQNQCTNLEDQCQQLHQQCYHLEEQYKKKLDEQRKQFEDQCKQVEEQRKQLEELLNSTHTETTALSKEKELLSLQNLELSALLQSSQSQLCASHEMCQELRDETQKLREGLNELMQEHEELQVIYQEERISKEGIKEELIELAKQVRFMEKTYKKQLTQHQMVKFELARFWEQRDVPLKDVKNNQSIQHSPTFYKKGEPNSKEEQKIFKAAGKQN